MIQALPNILEGQSFMESKQDNAKGQSKNIVQNKKVRVHAWKMKIKGVW